MRDQEVVPAKGLLCDATLVLRGVEKGAVLVHGLAILTHRLQ
jgi:hypothetical protein